MRASGETGRQRDRPRHRPKSARVGLFKGWATGWGGEGRASQAMVRGLHVILSPAGDLAKVWGQGGLSSGLCPDLASPTRPHRGCSENGLERAEKGLGTQS